MPRFKREAWTLQLPCLVNLRPSRFRLLESTGFKGERGFWEELALTQDTLAVEVTPESIQSFTDRLLMVGADPGRPVALFGSWPARPSAHRSQDFWGPLAPAADHWLRTGTLAETY